MCVLKSRKLMFILAMTSFTLLAIPARLAAQGNQEPNNKHKHHHYIRTASLKTIW